MTRPVEQIPELDVAAMVANMRPPNDDDVPIALDGTPLDTPAKVIAYLEEINARRAASEQRATGRTARPSTSMSCRGAPTTISSASPQPCASLVPRFASEV